MRLIDHKCWRRTTSNGALEFTSWDAMPFFYIDLSYYKDNIS